MTKRKCFDKDFFLMRAKIRVSVLSGLILLSSMFLFAQIKFEDVTEKAGLVEPLKGIAGHCAVFGDANGYASGYEAIAHFGLPDDEKADIRVTMPCNGPVYTARKVKRNQLFKLK